MGVVLNFLPKTIVLGNPDQNYSNVVPNMTATTSGGNTKGSSVVTQAPIANVAPSNDSTLPAFNITPSPTIQPVTQPTAPDQNTEPDFGSGPITFGGGGGGGGAAEESLAGDGKSLEVPKKKSLMPFVILVGAILLIWAMTRDKKATKAALAA